MRKIKLIISTLVLFITLTACTTINNKQITYTVYPIGYILQRLGGSYINSISIQNDEIVQRATIKENYEEILSSSSLFLHIGQLEPYIQLYRADINKLVKNRLDLSSLNAIYSFKRYTPINNDGTITYIEGPYYKGEIFDMVDIHNKELNLWLDPIAMLSMSKDIKEWLIKNYPEAKETFEENYKYLETDLVRLDAEYQQLSTKAFANNKEIKFVSMTASFGNWQKTYGIKLYPIILSKYGVLPNDEQLNIIKEKIKNDNVRYIVYEPNMTNDMIALFNDLKEELNLTRVDLSNLSSLTETQINNGKDYLSIMYENLSVLETIITDVISSEN